MNRLFNRAIDTGLDSTRNRKTDHYSNPTYLEPLRNAVLLALARAELPEVLRRLRADVGEQLQEDPAQRGGAHLHVEEDHRVVRVAQGGRDLGPRGAGRGGGGGGGGHGEDVGVGVRLFCMLCFVFVLLLHPEGRKLMKCSHSTSIFEFKYNFAVDSYGKILFLFLFTFITIGKEIFHECTALFVFPPPFFALRP